MQQQGSWRARGLTWTESAGSWVPHVKSEVRIVAKNDKVNEEL